MTDAPSWNYIKVTVSIVGGRTRRNSSGLIGDLRRSKGGNDGWRYEWRGPRRNRQILIHRKHPAQHRKHPVPYKGRTR